MTEEVNGRPELHSQRPAPAEPEAPSTTETGVMVASDLDRTLIYSPSALQLPMPDDEVPTLVAVEMLDGRPHSFLTWSACQRLAQIAARSSFVPITTRTVAQYQRVHFPDVAPHYAITSNGGNILIDGRPDEDWQRSTAAAIAACDADLTQVRHELRRRSQHDWAVKRRTGDDLFCYLVVEPTALPDDFVDSWTAWCADQGWRVSVQGRKIYAIPNPLTKERALLAVARTLGVQRVVAAGDGALDAGFLAAADAGIRPPHGELAALNWHHPDVQVSARPGVLAADDITQWFADQIRTWSTVPVPVAIG